jgi:hypothetical protein
MKISRIVYTLQESSEDGWQDIADSWESTFHNAQARMDKYIREKGCSPSNVRIVQTTDVDDQRYVILANLSHAERGMFHAEWEIVNKQWELRHAQWIANDLRDKYGDEIMIIDTVTRTVIPIRG